MRQATSAAPAKVGSWIILAFCRPKQGKGGHKSHVEAVDTMVSRA